LRTSDKIPECHVGAGKVILVDQYLDELGIGVAVDYADADALQSRHIGNGGSRRSDQQRHRMRKNNHRLRLREVADVTSDHGKIDLPGREGIGGIERARHLHHLQPHRRIRLDELACIGRNKPGGFAVE
jgi:hypothetical protein